MTRAKRIEELNVEFVDGMAKGWVFGVRDAFRMQLDIRLDSRVDTETNAAKKAKLGRPLNANEKATRRVWTEGAPPAYGFDRGHVFHDPPACHVTAAVPRRTLVVLLARPDAGALVQKIVFDENGEESTQTASDDVPHLGCGWVDYELFDYGADGVAVSREKSTLTQADFARLLRTGK